MIFGVGTDIVSVPRVRRLLTRFGDEFAKRILAQGEWPAYRASQRPDYFLAKCFAAKEAFAKALGTGMRKPVYFRSIGIRRNALGRPEIQPEPELALFLSQHGVQRWHLSLADEQDMAIAFVVMEQGEGAAA